MAFCPCKSWLSNILLPLQSLHCIALFRCWWKGIQTQETGGMQEHGRQPGLCNPPHTCNTLSWSPDMAASLPSCLLDMPISHHIYCKLPTGFTHPMDSPAASHLEQPVMKEYHTCQAGLAANLVFPCCTHLKPFHEPLNRARVNTIKSGAQPPSTSPSKHSPTTW